MELKKIESKKAQEFSITTLVVLVLAVIVLVIVVLGFWKGWDYIFGKIGFLPNDLSSAVAACKTYAGTEALTSAFCEYKSMTLNSVKGLWNCEGVLIEAGKSMSEVGYASKGAACKSAVDYCGSISNAANFKTVKINGNFDCVSSFVGPIPP